MPLGESFTYSSEPHSAPTKKLTKTIYRDDNNNSEIVPLTLMSDPRVVRGNTHSLAKKVNKSKILMSKTIDIPKQIVPPESNEIISFPSYNYYVKPFANDEIDISGYIIEKNDNPVKTKEVIVQTNEFNQRPATPPYVPRKTGVDVYTQVEDVKELFDFDKEVVGLLEVIVSKTIQQSIIEVNEEQELIEMQKCVERFQEIINLEEQQKREKEQQDIKEMKLMMEKVKLLEINKNEQLKVRTTVASLQMMNQIMPSCVEEIFQKLIIQNVFSEPDKVIARQSVLPGVMANTINITSAYESAQQVVEALLHDTESKFSSFTPFIPPEPQIRTFTINVRSTVTTTITTEEGVESEKMEKKIVSIVKATIGPCDSITTLEKQIQKDINNRKASSSLAQESESAIIEGEPEEGGEETTTTTTTAVSPSQEILPDASAITIAFLSRHLDQVISTQYRKAYSIDDDNSTLLTNNIKIPIDAILLNFPFPSNMEVYYDMD